MLELQNDIGQKKKIFRLVVKNVNPLVRKIMSIVNNCSKRSLTAKLSKLFCRDRQ